MLSCVSGTALGKASEPLVSSTAASSATFALRSDFQLVRLLIHALSFAPVEIRVRSSSSRTNRSRTALRSVPCDSIRATIGPTVSTR